MHEDYKSDLNRHVPVASPGEFSPLPLGERRVWPPVVLAPMAGVTNYPFRRLCRGFGAGLFVSEMITARPLVDGNKKTLKLADFGADESPRSLQLYGVDPHYVGLAVKRLVDEGRVDTYKGRTIGTRSSPAFRWLRANAEGFGFYNLPSEPWHWSVDGR